MLIEHKNLRQLLRYLHPEVTYTLSHFLFRTLPRPLLRILREEVVLETELMGIRLRNPVGVGAGIDKNGDLTEVFLELGCGFHVVGSVVLGKRKGNPHPRLYRYPQKLALINALGLPSKGVTYVVTRLGAVCKQIDTTIIVNIAGESIREFVTLARVLDRITCTKIIEINLSCPQYTRVDFHRASIVEELLSNMKKVCSKPILIKVSPRIDPTTLKSIVKVCEQFNNVGLTISNSFPTSASFLSSGIGGLSGLPLYKLVKKLIKYVRRFSDIAIVACGGIFSGKQVFELIEKYSVSAVQVVTALAYEGLLAVRRILKELKQLLY